MVRFTILMPRRPQIYRPRGRRWGVEFKGSRCELWKRPILASKSLGRVGGVWEALRHDVVISALLNQEWAVNYVD